LTNSATSFKAPNAFAIFSDSIFPTINQKLPAFDGKDGHGNFEGYFPDGDGVPETKGENDADQ
jgi:hypothetical protein